MLTILAFIFIFYLLWKIRNDTQWLFQEKLIFSGYVFILVTLLFFGSSIIYSPYTTFSTVQTDINQLSQLEIQTILHQMNLIFNQSTLSFSNFFQDLIQLFEKFKNILYTIDKIATIPTMIQHWWMNVLSLRQSIFISVLFSFSLIIFGHCIELWLFLKEKKRFYALKQKVETSPTDEQLMYVIEQQQKILQLLEKETLKNN